MTTNIDLSSKAMLVKLSISQWNPSKIDKQATTEIQTNHNAQSKTGRYTKNRLPKHSTQPIQKIANSARTFSYENTLPWSDSGFRILPSSNFLKYSDSMRAFSNDFSSSVYFFESNYNDYIESAKIELGTLFKIDDYPSINDIRNEFSFDVDFQPIPVSSDFRVSLQSSDIDRIKRNIESKFTENINNAISDLWRRLYDSVSHMALKLSDKDAIFRNSLINNLCELCDLLPALNITDDPKLEEMRREIETRLCAFEPDALRTDETERANAAREADAIAQMMAGYMV